MSGGIEYALQAAARAALIADAGLITLFGTTPRVFNKVPAGERQYPYINVLYQVVGDDDDCAEMSEVYLTAHVWSRTSSHEQVWAINERIRKALNTDLTLTGYSVIGVEFLSSRCLDDPDPTQTHGIVELRYEIETTS